MASKRMIRREQKRIALQKGRRKQRALLRARLNDPSLSIEEKFVILERLEGMPRDSSATRLTRRCQITGRARGVYRRFQLSRHELRRRAMRGEVPGLVKASW